MKDYKKLTSEQDFNCRECVDGECQKPDIFCPYRCECERYNRLYNLEDKIERGEIDYVAEKDKEIARLTAENDKLRARLGNAIELPTIYEHTIYPFVESLYTETIYYVVYKENGRIMTINCGKDKDRAEARLAEIKAEAKIKEQGGNV